MKNLLSSGRETVLHWIRVSPLFAVFYGCWSYLAAKYFIRNKYTTLCWLLNAVRRIPNLNTTRRHRKLIRSIIERTVGDSTKSSSPLMQNKLYDEFKKSPAFTSAKNEFASEPPEDRRRMRFHRENQGIERQGNLLILKPFRNNANEKGVILLKYNPSFAHFAAQFDLIKILRNYRIVFEPSSYRNIEADLFLYSGSGLRHIYECAQEDDAAVLNDLPNCLETIPIGSGDWTDISTFTAPSADVQKEYDLAMVAQYFKCKRHDVVMQGLAEWKKVRPDFKAVFVGCPRDIIKQLAAASGVWENCTVFEKLTHPEVSAVLQKSRMSIHFSDAEGTNRASYESWFCDVPLIVYKHNIGFRHSFITEQTGLAVDDNELAYAFEYIRTHAEQFSPREFLLARSGHENAACLLNGALKRVALENGEAWTEDIVAKKNGSNQVAVYAKEEDRLAMEPFYADLEQYYL